MKYTNRAIAHGENRVRKHPTQPLKSGEKGREAEYRLNRRVCKPNRSEPVSGALTVGLVRQLSGCARRNASFVSQSNDGIEQNGSYGFVYGRFV